MEERAIGIKALLPWLTAAAVLVGGAGAFYTVKGDLNALKTAHSDLKTKHENLTEKFNRTLVENQVLKQNTDAIEALRAIFAEARAVLHRRISDDKREAKAQHDLTAQQVTDLRLWLTRIEGKVDRLEESTRTPR